MHRRKSVAGAGLTGTVGLVVLVVSLVLEWPSLALGAGVAVPLAPVIAALFVLVIALAVVATRALAALRHIAAIGVVIAALALLASGQQYLREPTPRLSLGPFVGVLGGALLALGAAGVLAASEREGAETTIREGAVSLVSDAHLPRGDRAVRLGVIGFVGIALAGTLPWSSNPFDYTRYGPSFAYPVSETVSGSPSPLAALAFVLALGANKFPRLLHGVALVGSVFAFFGVFSVVHIARTPRTSLLIGPLLAITGGLALLLGAAGLLKHPHGQR